MLNLKPSFSLSTFTFIKRLFSSSSLSAIRVVSSVYRRLLIFLPAILIPACASSSRVSHDVLSIQFSHSVVSYSLRPHELQHARPPCPSPTPGVHSDSSIESVMSSSHLISVVPFSSCPQSLPASESFPVSQLFA